MSVPTAPPSYIHRREDLACISARMVPLQANTPPLPPTRQVRSFPLALQNLIIAV